MKKIFEKDFDDEVHSDFLKFGRGDYKNKYLVYGKKQSNKWAIKTGAEYANFLVRKCMEKVNGPVKIKGIIVATFDLSSEAEFKIKKVSNFQGVRKHQIETETEPKNILNLMQKYPRVFFALSFGGNDFDLKIKPKAPKGAKPGKDDEDPTADFCTLKTPDKTIINELLFDVNDFTEVTANHTIKINDIVYPSNLNELKPAEIREHAKRKGEIIRKVIVDGSEKTSSAEFIA